MSMTRHLLAIFLLCASAKAAERSFFAFDNGLTDVASFSDKAALLADLGYAGIGWRPGRTAEMLAELDERGLKMVATHVSLKPEGRGVPIPDGVIREIQVLKGRDTIVWLNLTDPGKVLDDEAALAAIRKVADTAKAAGLKVALYPHAGCYTDTAPNCLRLAKLAGRDNVGVSFNLCHFLSQTDPTKLEAELADLSPWLMLVSINGAENPPRSSILPLGQGGFDTGRVIRTLDKIGYRGPVGLQCFQIPKPARERLATSIKAWRKLCATPVPAAETKFKPGDPAPANSPAPTMVSDVPYGPHPKQVLHFWKAKSKRNTPLLFEIHGGGWIGGGRMSGLAGLLEPMLAAGISVVSIEYRFLDESTKDGVTPPIKGPMDDAARALQFVRSKAHEWDIDKRRIVASGSSAGACTALWLAFHDDMADPKSNDPVARESTRLFAVAANNAQTTLDPQQMREWIPNSVYGSLAFGIIKPGTKGVMDFEPFFARRDELLPLIKAYSPYYLATSDDPPVYLIYKTPPAIGQPQQDPTHSANFGVKLEELLREIKVECELVYPGAPAVIRSDMVEFITAKFTKTKQE